VRRVVVGRSCLVLGAWFRLGVLAHRFVSTGGRCPNMTKPLAQEGFAALTRLMASESAMAVPGAVPITPGVSAAGEGAARPA
jgi:hypothetical protein